MVSLNDSDFSLKLKPLRFVQLFNSLRSTHTVFDAEKAHQLSIYRWYCCAFVFLKANPNTSSSPKIDGTSQLKVQEQPKNKPCPTISFTLDRWSSLICSMAWGMSIWPSGYYAKLTAGGPTSHNWLHGVRINLPQLRQDSIGYPWCDLEIPTTVRTLFIVGWWFGTFFIFDNIFGIILPNCLVFFKMVKKQPTRICSATICFCPTYSRMTICNREYGL